MDSRFDPSVLYQKFTCIRAHLRAVGCVALPHHSDGYASVARLANDPQLHSRCDGELLEQDTSFAVPLDVTVSGLADCA